MGDSISETGLLPVASAVAGLIVLAIVLQDAFEVMLLPRRVQRRTRLASLYFRLVWRAWSAGIGRLLRGQSQQEALSYFGPLSMMLLFMLWAAGLITGFGLLDWALQASAGDAPVASLGNQLYMSGSTFFTLGYGDAVPHTGAGKLLAVAEAGAGLGFIAVVIGYLPVLYQLFSRRETHILQLDARAGTPPTATTLLSRHGQTGGIAQLDHLLRDWEVWASELLESHMSYPVLAFYRSQNSGQSWLGAVAAVMDTCALVLVGIPSVSPLQARMTFTMARQVLVELARAFRVFPSRFSGGDRLPAADYARLEVELQQAGIEWRGGADSEELLAALRATYEPLLDGLAAYLMLLPLPPWRSAAGEAADHWERGPRGALASRLIEQLANRDAALPAAGATDARWRRLRRLLRLPPAGGRSAGPPP